MKEERISNLEITKMTLLVEGLGVFFCKCIYYSLLIINLKVCLCFQSMS